MWRGGWARRAKLEKSAILPPRPRAVSGEPPRASRLRLRDSRLLSPPPHHPPPSSPTFSATVTPLRSTDGDHNYLLQKSQDQNPTFSLAGESERRKTAEKCTEREEKMDRLSRMLQAAQGMGMGGQGGGAAQVRQDTSLLQSLHYMPARCEMR